MFNPKIMSSSRWDSIRATELHLAETGSKNVLPGNNCNTHELKNKVLRYVDVPLIRALPCCFCTFVSGNLHVDTIDLVFSWWLGPNLFKSFGTTNPLDKLEC
jgi:hypothetical protein